MFTKFSRKDYNFTLLVLLIVAIVFGTVVINSADSSFTTKRIVGAVAGFILMIFISFVTIRILTR